MLSKAPNNAVIDIWSDRTSKRPGQYLFVLSHDPCNYILVTSRQILSHVFSLSLQHYTNAKVFGCLDQCKFLGRE